MSQVQRLEREKRALQNRLGYAWWRVYEAEAQARQERGKRVLAEVRLRKAQGLPSRIRFVRSRAAA